MIYLHIEGTNSVLELLSETKTIKKHNILRVLSPKPKLDMEELPSIKSRADLEHNPKLKENFNWLGTFEVIYEENIVTSNFDIWEKNKKITKYKQNIIDIANVLDNNLDKSILVDDLR